MKIEVDNEGIQSALSAQIAKALSAEVLEKINGEVVPILLAGLREKAVSFAVEMIFKARTEGHYFHSTTDAALKDSIRAHLLDPSKPMMSALDVQIFDEEVRASEKN